MRKEFRNFIGAFCVALLLTSAVRRAEVAAQSGAAALPARPETIEECAPGRPGGNPVREVTQTSGRNWPKSIEAAKEAIEIRTIREDNTRLSYIYCSENFQFAAPGKVDKTVLADLARVTEGTRELVRALPWGIALPALPGSFHSKLYDSRDAYAADLKASSPLNNVPSYAAYDNAARIMRIPLKFVLQPRAGALTMVHVVEPAPVVHEVTHQMMHDYLLFLPQWLTEGTAEYTAMLPLKNGVFNPGAAELGLKEHFRKLPSGARRLELVNVHELMRMTGAEWNSKAAKGGIDQARLYVGSLLLVYYFSHLDGDPKGIRLFKYFDKMAEARNAWVAFLNDPGVTLFPDGTIRSRIPFPPYDETFGFDNLEILRDGRKPEEIQKAFQDAMKKIGVK